MIDLPKLGSISSAEVATYLPETEYGLSVCRSHLDTYSDTDPSIASFLTRYLVVRMCAEIEQAIDKMLRVKIQNEASAPVANFAFGTRKSLVNNARFAEIGKLLELFGVDYKEQYEEHVRSSVEEGDIERLGNAVAARDATGHRAVPDLTFAELERAYIVAEKVVEAVAIALGQPNLQA